MMSKCRKIVGFIFVIVVLFFCLGLGGSESSANSIYLPLIMKPLTVIIGEGGKVKVSPIGTLTVQKGEKIALEITPENSDVVPILLINGEPVETTKSGTIYKYDLTVVMNSSVYATSAVETKLTPKAKIMDEATVNCLTSISADGSVLTFNCITPYLQSLQTDDVIIIGVTQATPYGFFRKITNIKIEGSQIIVGTTEAMLVEAIEEAEIIINKTLTADDITSFVPLLEGVTLQKKGLKGPLSSHCLSFENVLFDYDGNHSTENDQIKLGGQMCLDPKFNFALGIGWKTYHWIPYPTVKNLVLSTTLQQSSGLELSALVPLTFHKDIPIPAATYIFTPITVGPIVLVPMLTVNVSINASVVGGIVAGVTQQTYATLGIAYHNGDWGPISDFGSDFTFLPLPSIVAGAFAEVYAGPEFDLMLYGLAGNYVNVEGYFGIDMIPAADPWLSLYAGLRAGAGIKVGIFGYDLKKGFTLVDYRVGLVNLPGNKPPTITSLTASPTRVFTGSASTITLVASDPENNSLTCSWSVTGGNLSSTTGCDSVTWTAPGSPGTHTVSVFVKDNWPGSSPVKKGISIEVEQNLPPIITSLTPDMPSVLLGGATAVRLVVSDSENDPLTCTWEKDGGILPSTTGCDFVTWTAPGSPGTYTVKVYVTDNRPGHSPVEMVTTITVVTAVGCAQLTSPANGALLDNGCSDLSNYLTWDFAWTACSGATQYNIYVKHPNDAAPRIDTALNTTAYHHAGFFAIDDSHLSGWRWKVRAMINGFWTDWSFEEAFDVELLNTDCTPGAPTALSATDGDYEYQVRLTWSPPTGGATPTAYRIYRYTSNNYAAATQIGETAGLSFDDYDLRGLNYESHWYWVRAIRNTWLGPYSNGDIGYPTPPQVR